MKENYLNSNIKLNRFNGFLSVKVLLKVKDEVKKAREEFFKSRDINNNINDKFNKGEKMNQEIKNVEVPMNENTYKKWQRVPQEMQEKAIEAALIMLRRDEVFFYTFLMDALKKAKLEQKQSVKKKLNFLIRIFSTQIALSTYYDVKENI